MLINIENKEFITTQTISKIEILDGSVQLNNSVKFPVVLKCRHRILAHQS